VSDAWVTGYIGTFLATVPEQSAQSTSRKAWVFLENFQRNSGGWGYNCNVPSDADSTLWALHLSELLGLEAEDSAKLGFSFLEKHLNENGGISTYRSNSKIADFLGLPSELVSYQGWFGSHTCVTAAAAALPQFADRTLQYLRDRQLSDGSWSSYWWEASEYATFFASLAFDRHRNNPDDEIRLLNATKWALQRLNHFEHVDQRPLTLIAFCLLTLSLRMSYFEDQAIISKAVKWLLLSQMPDGSWPSSSKLRIPRPDIIDPNEVTEWQLWTGNLPAKLTHLKMLDYTFNIYSIDQHRQFSTATILRALQSLCPLSI
jgi:hypothetical protein